MTQPKPLVLVDDPFHIVPVKDLIPHSLTFGCPCEPVTTPDGLIVHNSFDGREHFEPTDEAVAAILGQEHPTAH